MMLLLLQTMTRTMRPTGLWYVTSSLREEPENITDGRDDDSESDTTRVGIENTLPIQSYPAEKARRGTDGLKTKGA